MWDVLYYLVMLGVVAGVAVGILYVVRAYMAGTTPLEMIMRPRPVPRLDVVEQANVDGRRRLLLIRRDDVEHLIMTGGPVDMVIETGIGEKPRRDIAVEPPATPIFSRPPRTFGQATPTAAPKEAAGGE